MQPSPEGARGGVAASQLSHLRLFLVHELIRQRQLLLAPTDLLMRRPVLAVWAAAGLFALQGLAGKVVLVELCVPSAGKLLCCLCCAKGWVCPAASLAKLVSQWSHSVL
jgi:hypothetical protein